MFSPKKIFLLDAIGAILSTLLLGYVLVRFEAYICMQSSVLYPLAVIASIFAIYSMTCHFLVKSNWKPYLRLIAIANSLYCVASIILVLLHLELLTNLGIVYFLAEFSVIIFIIYFESKTINKTVNY